MQKRGIFGHVDPVQCTIQTRCFHVRAVVPENVVLHGKKSRNKDKSKGKPNARPHCCVSSVNEPNRFKIILISYIMYVKKGFHVILLMLCTYTILLIKCCAFIRLQRARNQRLAKSAVVTK